ncbi:MAG: hypothetical protein E6I76_02835, partial [Chloroflexi bacterium]
MATCGPSPSPDRAGAARTTWSAHPAAARSRVPRPATRRPARRHRVDRPPGLRDRGRPSRPLRARRGGRGARRVRPRGGGAPLRGLPQRDRRPASGRGAPRRDADVVCVGISGAAALRPTLAALDAGTDVATATKEVLVMAGELVRARAAATGATVIPVDSEHSALWQCLRGEDPASVRRLVLTASGGPFRRRPLDTLAAVTVEEALRHPNWSMGPKITVDSATMMNKGLEIIEAHFLFDMPYARIDVVIHPPSVVHSCVEFCDGATLAQLGLPDMRVPIALALSGGRRLEGVCAPVDLAAASPLEFEEVD